MGAVADAFNTAFRDYVTDGVPSSGRNKPIKSQVRAIGTQVESQFATVNGRIDDIAELQAGGTAWKTSVRVATTANGAMATAYDNGSPIDGVTLVTGDRILIKNQTAGAENGIYVVAASGAPTRATDADTEAELLRAGVYVEEGSANAGTQWICETSTIVVGTTPLVWIKIGEVSAGAALQADLESIQTVGRTAAPISGTGVSSLTFAFGDPATASGRLRTLRAYVLTAGTLYVKRFRKSGNDFTQTGPDYPVVFGATGLRTVTDTDFGIIPVDAGDYLGFFPGTASISATNTTADGAGWYNNISGNSSAFTDTAPTTTTRIELGFDVGSGSIPDIWRAIGDVEIVKEIFSGRQTLGRNATPVTGSAVSSATFVFGEAATVDSTVRAIRAYAMSATTLYVKVFNKSGSDFIQEGADYSFALAAGLNTIWHNQIGAINLNAGQYLGFFGGTGIAFVSTTADSGGFYSAAGNLSAFNDSTVSTNLQLQIGFDLEEGRFPELEGKVVDVQRSVAGVPFGDAIIGATVAVDGLNVGMSIEFSRNGSVSVIPGTVAISTASSSNARYDIVYYDPEAGMFGVTAGTERATDPSAFLPTLSPGRMPVLLTRVQSGAVTYVPLYDVYNGEIRPLSTQLELERRRSRDCLRRTIGKIRRKATLRIFGFGDSITALQSQFPSETTVNGSYRDRAAATDPEGTHTYLRDNYGSDVVDALPLYTAAQLGRTPDANGAVYAKVGWNWELVAALVRAGYTLGTDVFYDNIAVGGYSSANAVTLPSTTLAWLNTATAYVTSNNVDLVVCACGMNEWADADTRARLVVVGNAFKAAGAEVLFMDSAYRRSGNVAQWEFTNRQIRAAAYATDSAYLPLGPLYDSRYIQAIGMTLADVCAANASNHPGLEEFKAIGRELSKTLLG